MNNLIKNLESADKKLKDHNSLTLTVLIEMLRGHGRGEEANEICRHYQTFAKHIHDQLITELRIEQSN